MLNRDEALALEVGQLIVFDGSTKVWAVAEVKSTETSLRVELDDPRNNDNHSFFTEANLAIASIALEDGSLAEPEVVDPAEAAAEAQFEADEAALEAVSPKKKKSKKA